MHDINEYISNSLQVEPSFTFEGRLSIVQYDKVTGKFNVTFDGEVQQIFHGTVKYQGDNKDEILAKFNLSEFDSYNFLGEPTVLIDKTYWKDELDRCAKSPYYFYTQYCTINGEKGTTMLTEEEFNDWFLDRTSTKLH